MDAKYKAIKVGLKFEGIVEISEKKFASRLTITGVEECFFQYEYENWTEEFGEKLNVFTGTGQQTPTFTNGSLIIMMEWKDEDSEYFGNYKVENHRISGKFYKTQGGQGVISLRELASK